MSASGTEPEEPGDGPARRLHPHIPKLLHQTYASKDLPESLAANVARLRKQNPDWQYRLYDDGDIVSFIREAYGEEMLSLFRRIDPVYGAARADFFRYLLMYRMGGVYLDIKSSFAGPISAFIDPDDRYVIGRWRNGVGQVDEGWGLCAELADVPGGEFQQWYIAAVPEHPFLKAVINAVVHKIRTYRGWVDDVGHKGVLQTTGPILYTRTIAPLLGQYDHRMALNDETGPQYNIFTRTGHYGVFKSHYTQQLKPVVRRDGWAGLLNRLYSLFRTARRAIHARLTGGRSRIGEGSGA